MFAEHSQHLVEGHRRGQEEGCHGVVYELGARGFVGVGGVSLHVAVGVVVDGVDALFLGFAEYADALFGGLEGVSHGVGYGAQGVGVAELFDYALLPQGFLGLAVAPPFLAGEGAVVCPFELFDGSLDVVDVVAVQGVFLRVEERLPEAEHFGGGEHGGRLGDVVSGDAFGDARHGGLYVLFREFPEVAECLCRGLSFGVESGLALYAVVACFRAAYFGEVVEAPACHAYLRVRGDVQQAVCGVFEVLFAGAAVDGFYGACEVCTAVGVEDFEPYHLVAGVGDRRELRAVEVALQAHSARYRGEASGQRLACRVAVFDVVFVAVAHIHHEVEDAAGARLFGRGGVGCGFPVAVAETVSRVACIPFLFDGAQRGVEAELFTPEQSVHSFDYCAYGLGRPAVESLHRNRDFREGYVAFGCVEFAALNYDAYIPVGVVASEVPSVGGMVGEAKRYRVAVVGTEDCVPRASVAAHGKHTC